MARFSSIILIYFVIGAVMWGGGAIAWDQTGLAGLVVQSPADGVQVNEQTVSTLEDAGGPIRQAAKQFGGPILAIWNILVKFIGYLFWPIFTLSSVNAPPRLVVLLGGAFSIAFIGSVLRLIRQSA